ncbi:DNA primase, large subunit [Macrolepiota fuliginosa MF-IS2]|uniref:DNA primase large subunit n=1 Tax=Macrolepiota fuliginosa MF-IS2 TaxID=1400762 RepID=A0A9P5XMI5_9AGAR|nr:DNA primase, large subunit [Macrolepiota fuliginosa MF-IS2]
MYKSGQRQHAYDNKDISLVENNGLLRYPSALNFYDRPPQFDVTVEEFETTAMDRLRVLAEIESSLARNRTWEELKTATYNQYMKYVPLHTNTYDDTEEERRKDHLGHYVLRLAFCRSEDLRRRFVKAELTLFRVRYEETEAMDREHFLSSRDFNWIPVTKEEKVQYNHGLYSMYHAFRHEQDRADAFEKEKFYKVKWTRVPDLVEKRKVFLKGGWAYVPGREQSSIVFKEFEVELERALETTARLIPRLDEDSRLIPVLDNLSQGFVAGVASEWTNATEPGSSGEIRAEMVDDLAKKHFPMCMRSLHENLRRDNHLKHFGRLQYGLFLKVLGLSVEEAIAFWRKSFSRVTDDKFNKEYRYNIRHSYGLEGKRANYPAKSCLQILTPGPSDVGCPYRHFSSENLQTALLSMYSQQGLKSADLPEIMATVDAGHYHVACTRVFEMTHAPHGVAKGEGIGGGESVTHPNQYAARSMELAKVKNEDDKMVE